MLKTCSKLISSNIYLLMGIVLGLYLSSFLSYTLQPLCALNPDSNEVNEPLRKFTPKATTPKRVSSSPKNVKLVRPRYYSTELGIREKVFIGIFSSEEKINSQAIHLNKTISDLFNQIKFFITAQYKLKNKFNVSGLVGFTDTRAKYRPFQALKYIGDSFGQDYDFYFLAHDHTFINARKLDDIVRKISVSMDVYLGTRVNDASYCNLDAGIILSNSVLKAMREHLDWCVMNAISEDHSENLGRCVHHSIGLTCQETLQEQTPKSFKLKHFELKPHFLGLSQRDDFNEAVTVHPILEGSSFYLLNAWFLKQRLKMVKKEIDSLSEELSESWPPGQRPGATPATRFDLPKTHYFNMTHMFFPDDFTNVRAHSMANLMDIKYVIEEIKLRVQEEDGEKFQFRRLVNGYRTFDLARGLDYVIDLGFRDRTTGKEEIRRFEVCKPLGKVEFTPAPYVTENSRITIVFPVEEFDVQMALEFLQGYANGIMNRKEKNFLLLVLVYQSDSESKGTSDVFYEIKNFATKTSNKYKNEDMKIAWLSVRLPAWPEKIRLVQFAVMDFAVVDLALKKIGVDSLVLFLDSHANITIDFLNRVRMNTISGFQVFSPIPFRQYNPKITLSTNMDVHKNNGHFDREEYRYVSFYGRDYVSARSKHRKNLPIVRVDNDIPEILRANYQGNIFQMFVQFADNLHAMRATEMSLKLKYNEATPSDRCNWFLGNNAQLGRYLYAHTQIT